MRALELLPWLTLSTLGCGATAGQDWLAEPLPAAAVSMAQSGERRALETETTPEARPRLRHTITLGESYVASSTSYASAPSGAASVQVNAYVPITFNNGYGYGGVGYVYAGDGQHRPPSHAQPSPPSQLQPGQNFPSPPSYGPSFPFRSAPASPWAR